MCTPPARDLAFGLQGIDDKDRSRTYGHLSQYAASRWRDLGIHTLFCLPRNFEEIHQHLTHAGLVYNAPV